MTEPKMAISWHGIMEHCSRLHTSRRKPVGPWPDAEMREASAILAVTINGRPVTIIPTRMHEPGFYWRCEDIEGEEGIMRDEESLRALEFLADTGQVIPVEGQGDDGGD